MTSNALTPPNDQVRTLLAALAAHWVEHRAQFLERIKVIENATAEAAGGNVDHEAWDAARSEAHKLKGSLGMFGLANAAEISAWLEQLFEHAAPGETLPSDLAEKVVSLRSLVETHSPDAGASPETDENATPLPALTVISPDSELVSRLNERLGWRFEINAVDSIDAFTANEPSTECGVIFDARAVNLADSFDWLPPIISGPRSVAVLATGLPLKRRVDLIESGISMVIDPTRPFDELVNAIREMAGDAPSTRGSLLAIDDDPALLRAIKTLVGPHLDSINIAEDADSAWEMLERERPDMVLADYDMPGVNGIELLQAMRSDARFSAIPVIMLTAHDDPGLIERIYSAGAVDCIQKPLTASKVTNRIFSRIQRLATASRAADAASPLSSAQSQPELETAPPVEFTVDIAIVDDDSIVSGLVAESAESLGYSVRKIADGEAAIDALCGDDPEVRPRLVLLDVDMPGRNGLHVLIQLASDGVTDVSRVIMLTGRSTESETLEALKSGASDHIAKPFSLPVLMEKIQTVLGK